MQHFVYYTRADMVQVCLPQHYSNVLVQKIFPTTPKASETHCIQKDITLIPYPFIRHLEYPCKDQEEQASPSVTVRLRLEAQEVF